MKSESIKELATALSKVKFGEIHKSKTVKVATKSGSSYNFAYAPMEDIMSAIRRPLAEEGLTLTQSVSYEGVDKRLGVVTTLSHLSGEWQESYCPVVVREGYTAQEMGSAITYARRYGVTLACCLVADEEDDANIADGNEVHKAAPLIAQNIDQEIALATIPPETLHALRAEAKATEGDFYTISAKTATARYNAFKATCNEDEIRALWSFLDSKVRNGMKRINDGLIKETA